VSLESEETPVTTRRAAIARGGILATAAAVLVAGKELFSVEAKRRRKRKKKKKKKKKQGRPFPIRLTADPMTGANEVPSSSGDPLGFGRAIFEIVSSDGICAQFQVNTLSANSTVILTHIHRGGAGTNGPVVIDFQGQLSNCADANQSLLNEVIATPEAFYANLHTNRFPNGAIRGQLRRV
jgi:hypothetical protein